MKVLDLASKAIFIIYFCDFHRFWLRVFIFLNLSDL